MILPHLLALAVAPTVALAAIFPPGTLVKSVDAKGFKKAMKESRTSVVAFVAPWCGHCQKLAPEYSKAAKSLSPLIPLYAVDCDAEENKPLCAEQKIEGFPTIKFFPRGDKKPSVTYQGERTTSAIVNFVSQRVPYTVAKLSEIQNILTWVDDNTKTPRALLLTKDKKIPMLWKVLSNRYNKLKFGIHKDSKGTTAQMLGIESGDTSSKILVYPSGSRVPARYEGTLKYAALSQFFESVLDGTADLNLVNTEVAKEDPPVKAKVEDPEPEDRPATFSEDEPAFAEHVAGSPSSDSIASSSPLHSTAASSSIDETLHVKSEAADTPLATPPVASDTTEGLSSTVLAAPADPSSEIVEESTFTDEIASQTAVVTPSSVAHSTTATSAEVVDHTSSIPPSQVPPQEGTIEQPIALLSTSVYTDQSDEAPPVTKSTVPPSQASQESSSRMPEAHSAGFRPDDEL